MNKQRREFIAKSVQEIYDVIATLEAVKDEEMEAYENMPENLQYSERGETMSDNIDSLEEIIEMLMDATTTLEDM